jgi:hypothetical protein
VDDAELAGRLDGAADRSLVDVELIGRKPAQERRELLEPDHDDVDIAGQPGLAVVDRRLGADDHILGPQRL